MKKYEFIVFILTYGRGDNVVTYQSLRKAGYNGRIVMVCSDDDKQLPKYKEKYGEDVVVFSKEDYVEGYDLMDNFGERRAILFARNACFDIAERLGYEYFIEMDDDFTAFNYRVPQGRILRAFPIKSISNIFQLYFTYMEAIGANTIAFAQPGDFIGGAGNVFPQRIMSRRKVMNLFFLTTKRRFKFSGMMNEDVTTYTTLGSRGELFLTVPHCTLTQQISQKSSGGMSEYYKDGGTYQKTMYSIMSHPSSIRIREMGWHFRRIHHNINWNRTVPRIIREEYKK